MEINRQRLIELKNESAIPNYNYAVQLVDQAVQSHNEYWKLIEAYQEHISGKKPVAADKLKKLGLSWASNWNYGKARAKIEKGTGDNISKIQSAIYMSYPVFRNFKAEDRNDKDLAFLESPETRALYSSRIATAFIKTLSRENRFSVFMNAAEYPSFAFGYAAVMWDDYDWMGEVIHPRNIAFEDKTKPDQINTWITFTNVKAGVLYDHWLEAKDEELNIKLTQEAQKKDGIKTKNRIRTSGWVIEGLEQILALAYKGEIDGVQQGAAPTWDRIIGSGLSGREITQNSHNINIAKIYTKEKDKTLSETYIVYNNAFASESRTVGWDTPNLNMILFKKNRGKFNQNSVINILRDSGFTETGYIQDFRGIAKYSVEDSIRYNRERNDLNNKMKMIGTPFFVAPTTTTGERFKITVSTGFNLVPPGATQLDKQPQYDVNSHLRVLQFEEGEHNRDTVQYDNQLQGRLGDRATKSEVQLTASELGKVKQSKNNIKLSDYANVFNNMLNKISSIATSEGDNGYDGQNFFFSYLMTSFKDINPTKEKLKKILKTIDSLFLEPIIQDIESLKMALQLSETSYGRNRIKRMIMFASGFTREEVDLNVPLLTDNFTNLSDQRVASIENDMFWTTNEVTFEGTDDHVAHLQSHQTKAGNVVKGFNEGAMDATTSYKYLVNILAHCRLHLQELERNKILEDQYKQFAQVQNDLEKYLNMIEEAAAKQQKQLQQQQVQQQALTPKDQAEIARANAVEQSKIERKDSITEHNMRSKEQQMAFNQENERRRIELEAENERLKIQLKAQNEREKNVQ